MALFKILKGEGNLPSTKNEGWAYVKKINDEAAEFYVDYDSNIRLQVGKQYKIVSATEDGLVPKFDAVKGRIDSSSSDWVLTNNNGTLGWYRLPTNALKNTTYTLSGAADSDTWVTTLTPSSGTATTSIVPAATATTAGLMTAADKAKLNAIPADATNNIGDITSVSAGIGLAGGATSGDATIKANLRSETKLTIDSAAATTTSGRVYPIAADKSGYLAVNVPWSDTDTGATSVEVTGTGNAITEASYDSTTRKLTLTKGKTYSNNKGDITSVTAGKGLTGGATSGAATLHVGQGAGIIVNDDDIAVNTGFATSDEKRNYGVQSDDDGSLYVHVPWTDTDTDTHYTTKIFAGSSGTAQNEGTTISDPYIKIADTVDGKNTYRNQIQIKGDGATTVEARSGVITINTPIQSVFSGVDTSGLVPQPTKGQEGYYLRGDGTWFNLTGMDESVQNTFGALQKAWKEADTSLKSTLTTLINGKAQTNHASTGTSYGVSSDTNYGHAKASSTTPKASAATAAVGSETASFARGDHVHPLSIAHSWGGTTLTTEINGISKTVSIPTATTSATGLMSADDKKKLDGIAAGATANTGDITGITTAATSGLTGGVTSGTAILAVNTSYTTSGKNYAIKVDSTSGGLYVNVPWTDTNYYHTPDWTSALASGQGTATGGSSTNIKIATGTGKNDMNDMYVPIATNSKPGLTIVYSTAQCSTYTTDTGAVTPAAAKQAVTKFAKATIGMPEENTMADYVLVSGDTLSGSLTFNNSSSTTQKDQPYLVWKTVGSNTPRIGFASDQSDGTFLIASLGGTTYQSGLAIGGGSGNLLWKGKRVLTIDDSYSHPAGSGASQTEGLYKFSTDGTSHISSVTAVKKADITALGIPAQDTTYDAATQSVAGLMSAADKKKLDDIATGANKIIVDSALSTTSTNPVQNKVVTTALSGKADLSEGAIFIQGSGTTNDTAKTSTWLGTSDKITAYYDGLTIRYKIGIKGQSTTTLNINNLGAKTVYRFSDSKLTTHFPVNSIIHLIYHADLNGGCWMCSDYDANTNTYQRVYPSTGDVEYPITTRYATSTGKDYYAEYGRYSTGVTLNPSTNIITAAGFNGPATSADAFTSEATITLTGDVTGSNSSTKGWSIATTLANSGVTAGSYGPSANASPSHGGTFSVPYITFDAKGRATAASSKTITLPNDRLFVTLVPTGTSIPASADLNSVSYLKVGRYYCSKTVDAATLKNCPVSVAFMMEVSNPLSTTIDNETTGTWVYRLRKITEYHTGRQYYQFANVNATANNWTYGSWRVNAMSDFTIATDDTNGGSAAKGSATQPVYINNAGDLKTCTYSLEKSVPSDAVFTDTQVTQNVTTSNEAFPLLLAPSGQTETTTATSYFDSGVTLNPSTNTIAANISGNAAQLTSITETDKASDSDVWRRIWMGWSNNTTGRPAYDDRFAIQTSTGTLKAPIFLGNLTGTATQATQDGDGNVITATYVKLAGDTMTGKLALGRSSQDGMTDAVGLHVHDLRNATITADTFGNNSVNFIFDNGLGGSGWRSAIQMKGWNGAYAAWQLSGGADNSVSNALYYREGIGSTWGTWYSIPFENRANTFTSLNTFSSGNTHNGIKIGDTYINAIGGQLIFQNNTAIRFGGDTWDYNIWAGLNYVHSTKTISLGLADNVTFAANNAQSDGTLALPGIRYFSINGKQVLDARDSWLRINEGNAFSGGVYFGTGVVRTDGQLQVGSGGSAFYAKSDGTGYFKSNLKVDGKLIMTGNIAYTNGSNQYDMIQFVTGDKNGAGLVLGGGGVVIIGSGESASNLQSSPEANIAGSSETTYITSDNNIEFYTNCQTIGNRAGVILNTSRHFYPNVNNTGSLGTTSNKWSTGHFYGSVNAGSVWAAHQTGGEANIGVRYASGKNLYLYANNSTGARGLYDSNKGTIISVTDSTASFNGNASTASAWATARALTLGGDLEGSVSVKGNSDMTLTATAYQCSVGSNNTSSYPYHRIAYITNKNGTYSDTDCILDIRKCYDNPGFGRIKISFRTNNSGVAVACSARWMYRSGFAADDIVVAWWGVTGDACYADVFLKVGSWARTTVSQPYGSRSWTLVSSSEGTDGANPVEAYASVASAGTALHNKAYTATASAVDTSIVNYANSAGSVAWTNVTGKPSTFNPSSHTHDYLPLSGGTITGNVDFASSTSTTDPIGQRIVINGVQNDTTVANAPGIGFHIPNVTWGSLKFCSDGSFKFYDNSCSSFMPIYGSKVYGAVWNDYAEYRNQETNIEPGFVAYCDNNGKLKITTNRLQKFEGVVSDTFGFAIGENEVNKTPIAVSGRVLVYTQEPREQFNSGDCVCAGLNGTVSKMTREEIIQYPDRIVGVVSEIPEYDTWGSGDVKVNGRIWIKVK